MLASHDVGYPLIQTLAEGLDAIKVVLLSAHSTRLCVVSVKGVHRGVG